MPQLWSAVMSGSGDGRKRRAHCIATGNSEDQHAATTFHGPVVKGESTRFDDHIRRKKEDLAAPPTVENDQIELFPLGAAQEVGRSCFLLAVEGFLLMLDCGIHPLYNDHRRFPKFDQAAAFICRKRRQFASGRPDNANTSAEREAGNKSLSELLDMVDCVLITHFHLDHAGALPLLHLASNYSGPIVMTAPTAALIPLMLKEAFGVRFRHTYAHLCSPQSMNDAVKKCIATSVIVQRNQTWRLCRKGDSTARTAHGVLEVTPFYAGHVLGAVMYHIKIGAVSIVYTGDYNMKPTHHLSAANVPALKPNFVITESTFASKRRHNSWLSCETVFMQHIGATIRNGGKVLIPCSSTGPVQDMCLMLEQYCKIHSLDLPIYLSSGLSEKALTFYQMYCHWTRDHDVKHAQGVRWQNKFAFSHIKPLPGHLTRQDSEWHKNLPPMVVLSTPGMLQGGRSQKLLKLWCGDPRNLVLLPGYCSAGSVGFRLQRGARMINLDGVKYNVRCKTVSVSFNCHTDQTGILDLLRKLQPESVALVHGQSRQMQTLKSIVERMFNIPCGIPVCHKPYAVCTPRAALDQAVADLTPSHGLLLHTWFVWCTFPRCICELKNLTLAHSVAFRQNVRTDAKSLAVHAHGDKLTVHVEEPPTVVSINCELLRASVALLCCQPS